MNTPQTSHTYIQLFSDTFVLADEEHSNMHNEVRLARLCSVE